MLIPLKTILPVGLCHYLPITSTSSLNRPCVSLQCSASALLKQPIWHLSPSAYQITVLCTTCTKKAKFLQCQHLQIPYGSYHFLPLSSPRESTYPSYSWKTLTPEKKIVFFLVCFATYYPCDQMQVTWPLWDTSFLPGKWEYCLPHKIAVKIQDSMLKMPHSMPDTYFVLSKCFLSISPFLFALLLIPSFELRSIKMENKNQLAFAMRHTETGNLMFISD